jgi:hypothetical protein
MGNKAEVPKRETESRELMEWEKEGWEFGSGILEMTVSKSNT